MKGYAARNTTYQLIKEPCLQDQKPSAIGTSHSLQRLLRGAVSTELTPL